MEVFNNKVVLQWGYLSSVAQGGSVKVTLPKAFTSTKYASFAIPYSSTNTWANGGTHSKTKTTVDIINITNAGGNRPYHWFVIGF